MPNERNRHQLLKMDIDGIVRPFDDERLYLQKLRQTTSIESILMHLFDLLEIEDYRLLFGSSKEFDCQWLKSFSQLCMKRYLECDEIFFFPKSTTNNNKSIVENYINSFIEKVKIHFPIDYFYVILNEFEQLNRFKIEQISEQLQINNRLIEQIRLLLIKKNSTINDEVESNKDDSVIHLSSTPAQIVARVTYITYKPTHMVYFSENLLIKNDFDTRLPAKGVNTSFVADLIKTKSINIRDETTGKTYDVPTKWLYFAKKAEANVALLLRLRVATVDSSTGRRRYGFISEEPGKNNDYRCLVFFTDDPENISASYQLSSSLHICLDQTYSTHAHECPSEFLERYFASYPERMMLRAKENTTVKVRNIFAQQNVNQSTFLPALVIQIDGSMMQIEFSHNKQRLWLYRGSPLLDQMHTYYSTQNQATPRHTARQHLSARRTNVPEIICLNDESINRNKSARSAEQILDGNDEIQALKRARISSEHDLPKTSSTTTTSAGLRNLRPRQNNSTSVSSNATTTTNPIRQSPSGSSIQTRATHSNTHSRIVLNPLFLELAEKFLLHYSYEFHPHQCSHKCVVYSEKNFHQLPRTMNPFLKPFACHWTMLENVRVRKAGDVRLKATRSSAIYCAPCGRKLLNQAQIDYYLHETKSKLTIELFVLDRSVNLKQHYYPDGKILTVDISNGLENVPISVVNEVDKEPNKIEEPSSFTYRVERTPVSGVRMIINEPTMTCCVCTDGCRDRTKCACWLRTLKYAELIGDERLKSIKRKYRKQAEILNQMGYRHRRLLKNVPGGIFECNNRCSCHKQTCSNRVVQNGIIAQLQLFKTVGRGWGVRTLHDLPVGTFISVYSGEIFTSEQADERGKLLGDEYQADLDFFENINHDSEEEHPNNGNLDDDEDGNDSSPSSTESVSTRVRNTNIQTRARELLHKKNSKKSSQFRSDDGDSILNRTGLPDYDGVVYTLDAKLIGNIGRYFNHSCSPNIAVQNVFVDTHDIHFPWIGFFATKTIRSGSELCWDYNYTVGEIAGRRMDCNCGSAECRRRVL